MTIPSDRYRAGCNWHTPAGRCGQPGRLYPVGIRCPRHLPNHHLKTSLEGSDRERRQSAR